MPAKPTIDIVVEVHDISLIDSINPTLQQHGYEAWGAYHIPNSRFFVKGNIKRTHHLHAFNKNDPDIHRHIAFRDYLTQMPQRAQDYAHLKIKLAKQFRHNRRAYFKGKQDLIKTIEKEALHFFNK